MLARASIAATRHSGFYFWTLIMIVVVIPASQLVLAVAYDHGPGAWSWPEWNNAVFAPSGYLIIFLLVPYAESAWRLRRMPAAWSQLSVSVDAAGASFTGGNTTRTIGWSAISRVVETREFLLFYQGPVQATFVPLSAFATPQELADFRQVLIDAKRLRPLPPARHARFASH